MSVPAVILRFMQIQKTCVQCGIEFPTRREGQEVCSRRCNALRRIGEGIRKPKTAQTYICFKCGHSFERVPSQVTTAVPYCSRSCAASSRTGEDAGRWAGGPIERECQTCHTSFLAKASKVKSGRALYCSRKCWPSPFARRGIESALWKGGPENWKHQTREEKTAYMREWGKRNRDKQYSYQRTARKKLREQVANLLGRQCIGCGFDDERALQIDHKDGGGNAHFSTFKKKGGREAFLKAVLAEPGKFQILCANCNWIKRHEKKEGVGFGSQPKRTAIGE